MNPDELSSLSTGSVLVIGAAGIDLVGRLRGELHLETSNPASIRSSYGGVARNIAENLARLGQQVTLLAVVGADQIGAQLMSSLGGLGVDIGSVLLSDQYPTSSYLAVVNSRGRLQFALDDMRATALISPGYLAANEDRFRDAALIFVDTNVSKDSLRTIFRFARRYQLPVCADPTSTSLASRLKSYLPHIHLITLNAAEAGVLCDRQFDSNSSDEGMEAAKCLVAQGVQVAILTMGDYGVCYATSETGGYVPAIHAEIIDPTGASDALCAAVIFALMNDIPIDDAVRLGVSAAALTLGHTGTVLADLSLEKLYDGLVI